MSKRTFVALTILFALQNIAETKEITLMDRFTHPVATIKHSFAWTLDPLNLISVLNGGSVDPRRTDAVNYKKYITGENDSYYLREPR